MMCIKSATILFFACTSACLWSPSFSFVSTTPLATHSTSNYKTNNANADLFGENTHLTSQTSLSMGLFGDIGSSLFGNKEQADPSKPTRVMEIPAKNLKVGGLRFTLGLILISKQNEPNKGTWKANQAGDGVLDMYFLVDNTAMFSIDMNEKSITIDRYGATPSLQYMLQESLILHEVLDELETLAFGGEEDIADENRLVQLMEPGDAIKIAREKLPARKA